MLNIGIVGAAGRGSSFVDACKASGVFRIHAVCDVNAAKLEECRAQCGASEKYEDYAEMLARSDLQAVIIGTPMPFHASQAAAALERGIHVLSEVPAGVSVEECRRIVQACKTSKALYMMAENYTYMKPNAVIRENGRSRAIRSNILRRR